MKAAVLALLFRSSGAGRATAAVQVQPNGPTLDERSKTTGCSLLSLESSVRSASLLGLEDRAVSKHRSALRGHGLLQMRTQTGSAIVKEAGHREDVSGPFSAGWFGEFSQGESTYRTDGLDSRPSFPEQHADQNDFYPRTEEAAGHEGYAGVIMAKPDTWFQETESGGAERAWQTYFPAVGNFHSREQQLTPWRGTSSGSFQEVYKPDEKVAELAANTETKTASWFDSSVSQYDAFGRGKLPSEESNERYVEWQRRSRSVNISCADPGCEANASLKLFDHAREAHDACKLSLHVHPTDFDDEFSREYVELVHINGRTLNLRCHPKVSARGCTEEALLQPCIEDYSLDGLVGKDGKLELTGRISPMVDECPVDGRLLSGEIVVDCLVHPSWLAPPDPEQPVTKWTTTPPPSRVAKLQCSEPGCTASATVLLKQEDLANKTCRLTVTMAQTDFDGDHGSVEEVEWVKVEGNITREHAKPGGNPCKGVTNDAADPDPSSVALAATGNASNATASPAGNGTTAGPGNSTTTAKPGSSTTSTGANGGSATTAKPGSSTTSTGANGGDTTTVSPTTAGPGSPGKTTAGPGSGANAGPGTTASTGSSTTTGGSGSGDATTVGPGTTTAGRGSGAGAGAPGLRTTTASPGSSTTAGPPGGRSTTTAGPPAGARRNTTATGDLNNATAAGPGVGGNNATQYSFLASSTTSPPATTVAPATTAAPTTTGTTTQHVGGGILGDALGGGGSLSGSDAGSVVEDEKKLDEHRYVLLNGTDVTEAALDGHVEVSAKISAMVDECGSNGFLLDAEAVIECS